MTKTVVQKRQPYPIQVSIAKEGAPAPILGIILKLTEVGFLMKVNQVHFFKVAENFEISFQIPTTGITVKESVKVIKTYDLITDQVGISAEKMYTVEMHFRKLSTESRKAILFFTQRIGQK